MALKTSQEIKDYLKSLTYVEIDDLLFCPNDLIEEFIDDVNAELNFDVNSEYSDEQQREFIMYLHKCIWDIKNYLL